LIAHRFIPTSVEKVKREMIQKLNINSIEELFEPIPYKLKLKRELNIKCFYSEIELVNHIESLLNKNKCCKDLPIFLGGGIWPHYVPAVVDEVASRAEFVTSYTPYQPEISQGMLQSLFEYQSMICELTGMDYANCSLYDWSSGLGEAVRMALRVTKRKKVIVPNFIHPERLLTLKSYIEPIGVKLVKVKQSLDDGQIIIEELKKMVDDDTSCIYFENPSYLGFVEQNVDELASIAHSKNALLIVGVDPISLGFLREPGDYNADIVVGEGQPLGLGMNFGGPLLGILACKGERLLRQMPGRIVSMTTTIDGKDKAFCNALQAREQHIRREKATSNICTNEALMALRAAIYLALLGKNGIKELGEVIVAKTNYAIKRLREISGLEVPAFNTFHFKEFVIRYMNGKSAKEIHRKLLKMNVHGGKILKNEFPELGESALYCFTEIHTKEQIDYLAECLEKVVRGG
jgi:glycine dehydrogenase subunit 1